MTFHGTPLFNLPDLIFRVTHKSVTLLIVLAVFRFLLGKTK